MEQSSSSLPRSYLGEAEALKLLDKIHDNEEIDEAIPKLLSMAQTLLKSPDSNLGRMMLYLRASCMELDDKVQDGNQPFQELVKCINNIAEKHHLRKLPSLKHEEKTFLDRFRDVGAEVLKLVRTKEEEDLALDSEYWIEARGLTLDSGDERYQGHFYPAKDTRIGLHLHKWQTQINNDGQPFREVMNFKTYLETYAKDEFASYESLDVHYLTPKELDTLRVTFDSEGLPLLPSNHFSLWLNTYNDKYKTFDDSYRNFLKELPSEEVLKEPTPLPPGEYLFLVNTEGELLIAKKVKGEMHHSSLSQGKPAKSVGELTIGADGKISSINAYSGHYKPFSKHLMPFLEIFERNSLPFSFQIEGQYQNGKSFVIPKENIEEYLGIRQEFSPLLNAFQIELEKPYSEETDDLMLNLVHFQRRAGSDLELKEEIRQLITKLMQKKISNSLSNEASPDLNLLKDLASVYKTHLQTNEERTLFLYLKKKVLDSRPSQEELEVLRSIRASQALLRKEDFEVISKTKSYHKLISLSPEPPVRSNLRDPDLEKLWIESHEKDVREPLRKLCERLVHVSFEDLEVSFEKSIDAFNLWIEEQKNKDYLCVVANGKSNIWMAELALPHLSRLPTEIWDSNLDNFTNFVISSRMEHLQADLYIPSNIVFFDDGIYSGEQMAKFICLALGSFIPLHEIFGAPPPKIIVISAYATTYGMDKVKAAAENYYRVKTMDIPFIERLEEKVRKGDESVDDLESVIKAKASLIETKEALERLKLAYNSEKKKWKEEIKSLSPPPDAQELFELRKAFDARNKPYKEAKIEYNLALSRYESAISDGHQNLQKIKTARERQDKVLELFFDKIIVMPFTPIQTVAQVLEDDTHTIDVLNKMWWPEETGQDIYSRGAESHGAFYFDHKVPDLVSFPEALESGLIFTSDNRVLTEKGYLEGAIVNPDSKIYDPLTRPVIIPFIPKTVPPYKPEFESFKKEI
ncbi:hypothetical protein [Criblamydia sequanensis]|uniref:PRTase-CE domain-containing protein n=1 Tax=Candidatus Criblamydia sequanensis CRIB-18 TaxID=1437425 RepID=A0A090DZB9_9BACT|nr:hypothetical protein [Criblamydia sequanensis]CDR34024.1 hypothetical protein CSEC_1201 [Criblamydia sequanensis CRIB-18]